MPENQKLLIVECEAESHAEKACAEGGRHVINGTYVIERVSLRRVSSSQLETSYNPCTAQEPMEINSVIERYFDETTQQGELPSIAGFVNSHVEFIAHNSAVSEQHEVVWCSRISNVAQRKGVKLSKSNEKPKWEDIASTIKTSTIRTGNTSESGKKSSSNSESSQAMFTGTKRSSNSTGSKTDSCLMTEAMFAEYENKFTAMENDCKWELPDGSYVENILYEFGKSCPYENLAHSFVLNIDDPEMCNLFTSEQLEAIKEAGRTTFPSLPTGVESMFKDFSEVISNMFEKSDPNALVTDKQEQQLVRAMWKTLTTYGFFDPETNHDEDWLQRTMFEILDMYRFDAFDFLATSGSEMDFIVQLWSKLDTCFRDLKVQTRRDHTCKATMIRENPDRRVTGTSSISRRQTSVRPDLIFYRNGVEYGVGEVGKEDLYGIGTKEIVESQLHCPKIMQDMMVLMVRKCNNKQSALRSLRIVAQNQTHLRMSVSVLDSPGGYIFRLRSTPKYTISPLPSFMLKGIIPILKLVLKTKLIIRESIAISERLQAKCESETNFVCNIISDEDKIVILPSAARSKRHKTI